jgi:hypothetical protein
MARTERSRCAPALDLIGEKKVLTFLRRVHRIAATQAFQPLDSACANSN